MSATIIPFPTPTPKTVESACRSCGVTAKRLVEELIGMPIVACACGTSWLDMDTLMEDDVA
jgi:hypothetical protein